MGISKEALDRATLIPALKGRMDKWMLAMSMAQVHKGSVKDLDAAGCTSSFPPSFITMV